ncbi:MAG: TonB-dependent receptor plug domain-containing protein, partial [Prevotella sp.]|nr:TonB-dependent receptor plug domain-containing protein [Prevotella sp.]
MFTYNEVESYKVNASVHTSSFEEALRTVIGNYPLNYKIEGKIVTVKLAHKTTPDRERTINGTVVDEIGEPLPGATITPHTESALTQSAVITDAEGQFRITVGSDVQRLEVSYIGFGTQFVNLTGSNSYTITMHEDAHRLDNVVVTGIFPKRKDAYTGAVTTITSEELKNFGNKNLITSIGNIDPAFNILTNNELGSNPNRLPEIQIRGNANLPALDDLQDNTKTDLNTPLIVLDGFEISLERLMDLNDDDVESITLLKDGSATAIYGSRGANGVVVISRKAPQVGRLKLSYNGSLNIEAPDLTDYHLLNAADKLELERRAGYYDMVDPQRDFNYKNKYASILKDVQRGVDTDWMALPLRTGVGQRHNMRIEGGDASFRYSASLQYNGVTGVMKGSNRNTFNGGINLTYRHQKLIFNNDLNIGYTKSKESPYGTFSQYTRLNPYWRPYDDNGEIIKMFDNDVNFWGTYSNLPTNPLYNATLRQKNSTNYTNITNNFAIEWRPFAGFIARGSLGLTWQDT